MAGSRLFRTFIGAAVITAALITPAGPAVAASGGSGGPACNTPSVPTVSSVTTHAGYTNAFTDYGNTGGGWTGGDSTYSVPQKGSTLWLFSDTFLGTVEPGGSRPNDGPIVNNTFVQQRGDRFRTIHGGTTAEPDAMLPKPADDAWYWLGAGQISGDALQVSFQRYDRFGPGQWDWKWTNNVMARYSTRDFRKLDVTPMPSGHGVAWASWLERIGGHTYVYGVEDKGAVKNMHIARVKGDDLRKHWEFWNGRGWSRDQADSVAVQPGVANEYSVTRYRNGYLLITQDTTSIFNPDIVAYFSCSPTGPFVDKTVLYQTPEGGLSGTYGNANIFTYNAHEHPDLRKSNGRGDKLLVTYNVNSFEWDDVIKDVTIYRPRFLEVTFAR